MAAAHLPLHSLAQQALLGEIEGGDPGGAEFTDQLRPKHVSAGHEFVRGPPHHATKHARRVRTVPDRRPPMRRGHGPRECVDQRRAERSLCGRTLERNGPVKAAEMHGPSLDRAAAAEDQARRRPG